MMREPKPGKTMTEQPAGCSPLSAELCGDAGAPARQQMTVKLDTIAARIQAQRSAGVSREGFPVLEGVAEAIMAAQALVKSMTGAHG